MEVSMPTVSVAEFIRNFGTFQRMVAREPIEVTSRGKVAGVYVSAEDAALLKRIRASRQAYHLGNCRMISGRRCGRPNRVWKATAWTI
jgi:hypothetical protein